MLNFLKGGLMTALLEMTQCRPTLTLARSPLRTGLSAPSHGRGSLQDQHDAQYCQSSRHLMMASDCTMFLPLRMMFWEPQSTLALDTLLPLAVSMYSALLKGMSGNSMIVCKNIFKASVSLRTNPSKHNSQRSNVPLYDQAY